MELKDVKGIGTKSLALLNKLREDLGISLDMTKNYLVFNFQFGGKDYESNKN